MLTRIVCSTGCTSQEPKRQAMGISASLEPETLLPPERLLPPRIASPAASPAKPPPPPMDCTTKPGEVLPVVWSLPLTVAVMGALVACSVPLAPRVEEVRLSIRAQPPPPPMDWRMAAAERLPAVAMVLPPVEVNWMAPADAFAPSGVRPRFL